MRRVLAVVLAAALAGCAAQRQGSPPAVPPAPGSPTATSAPAPAAPPPGSTVGSTASGGTIRINPSPTPAVADSSPTPEALAVLSTIPEPFGTSVPESLAVRPGWGAPTAPTDADSAAIPANPAVPVPEPTEPLGDRPGSSSAMVAPVIPAALPLATAAPMPPDSCWRVQFAAPLDKAEGDMMAEAARSQLMIPIVIDVESGRHKVRSRDCATASVAEDLKRRAQASGFDGAFRFLPKKP